MKANEEQMKHIAEILGDTYNHTVLNFEKETDGGYEDYNDRIYIDGNITFDQMDKIVKYIKRSRCNELLTIEHKYKDLQEKANEYAKDYLFSTLPQRTPNVHYEEGYKQGWKDAIEKCCLYMENCKGYVVSGNKCNYDNFIKFMDE